MADTAVEQHFHFLDLPAEIRNRIYELAVEDAKAIQEADPPNLHKVEAMHYWARFERRKDMLPRLISPKRNKYLRYATPNTLDSWSSLHRPYLGLSQTCSEIQREFLPMYSMVCTGVDLKDLDLYLRLFVVRRAGGSIDYRGNMDIGLRGKGGYDICIRDAPILINTSPNVRAEFTSHEIEEYAELGDDVVDSNLGSVLLNSRLLYPKFWDFLSTKISSVALEAVQLEALRARDGIFLYGQFVPRLTFWVKAEFAEDWMYQPYSKEEAGWRIELGLPVGARIRLKVDKE